MAVLSEPVKLAIVRALACFDTPTQAAEAVALEFGIKVDRFQVAKYDPTKPAGQKISKKLVQFFNDTRAAFLQDIASIPIAQQAYRLRVLQRTLAKVESQGNTAMVAQLLEQAAKESGGAFTNRREITGKDGGPIQANSVTMSPEQAQEATKSALDKLLARG